MDTLRPKIISPQSLLIEKTALELACCFYEAGRSSGLTSKHKGPRAFAKANVEKFIPKAVDLLMDIMANPATPKEQKDLIYDSFMERTNDVDLSNIGLKVMENPFAATFKPDTAPKSDPVIINTQSIESLLFDSLLENPKVKNG